VPGSSNESSDDPRRLSRRPDAPDVVATARCYLDPVTVDSETYLLFEVRLLDVDDAPWRRLLLRPTASFEDLHLAIQDACGWENCHLFAFRETRTDSVLAGIPDDEFGAPDPDAANVRLWQFFAPERRTKCLYQYDFGDDWRHEVELIEVVTSAEHFTRRLVAGERAFPREDCGGPPGYEDCRAVARGSSPTHIDDADELKRWLGDWDPDQFDLESTRALFND
jgi:hypothetical protein